MAAPIKTNEANHTTRVRIHASICTALKRFTVVFENNTATNFVYTAMVLGQPNGLSKEARLYAGADWLSSPVSQRVARGQLQSQTKWELTSPFH